MLYGERILLILFITEFICILQLFLMRIQEKSLDTPYLLCIPKNLHLKQLKWHFNIHRLSHRSFTQTNEVNTEVS